MINLTEQELKWGINCLESIKLGIDNKLNIIDKSYLEFITNIDKNTYEDIVRILDDVDKINTNEEVNKKFIDVLDTINGFWYWQDYSSREEVKHYVNDDIFVNYIGKIYEIWEYENTDEE